MRGQGVAGWGAATRHGIALQRAWRPVGPPSERRWCAPLPIPWLPQLRPRGAPPVFPISQKLLAVPPGLFLIPFPGPSLWQHTGNSPGCSPHYRRRLFVPLNCRPRAGASGRRKAIYGLPRPAAGKGAAIMAELLPWLAGSTDAAGGVACSCALRATLGVCIPRSQWGAVDSRPGIRHVSGHVWGP